MGIDACAIPFERAGCAPSLVVRREIVRFGERHGGILVPNAEDRLVDCHVSPPGRFVALRIRGGHGNPLPLLRHFAPRKPRLGELVGRSPVRRPSCMRRQILPRRPLLRAYPQLGRRPLPSTSEGPPAQGGRAQTNQTDPRRLRGGPGVVGVGPSAGTEPVRGSTGGVGRLTGATGWENYTDPAHAAPNRA